MTEAQIVCLRQEKQTEKRDTSKCGMTIAGHGHLLVLVASIYDEAFYLTTEEMRERGVIMDVLSVAEKLARSDFSDVEQGMYNEVFWIC